MDTDRLRELAPHYLAMLILVLVIPAAIRTVVGDLGFWVDLAIIFAIVFTYRPLVKRLDMAPSGW